MGSSYDNGSSMWHRDPADDGALDHLLSKDAMTTTLVPVPVHNAVLAVVSPAVAEIVEALPHIETFTITTQADFEQSRAVIDFLAGQLKTLKAERETITKPLYQAHRASCDLFRPAIEPRERAIAILKAAGEAYLTEERRKAEAALAAAAALGSVEAIAAVEVPVVPKGTSARTNVTYEIVDEKLVPDEFWMLNHSAIDRAVREGVEIPGVKRVLKTDLRRTGRT